MTHDFNPDIVEELEAHYISRDDVINRWGNAVSSFLAIHGLVGFWPMSSVQRSTGNAYDVSGQSRTLTYNGNPVYRTGEFGILPVIAFDGTGDFLSRADETDLDVLGTETIYASNGLTIGGWFRLDSTATSAGLIGKWNTTGNQRSYLLSLFNTTPTFRFNISGNGATAESFDSTVTITTSQWYFVVGRWEPSSERAIWVNDTKSTTTSAIASLFNGTSDFVIASQGGTPSFISGRATLCFLCATALTDAAINGLFQQTRALFDV